ncbi:MAG: hypothetical protein UT34_C0001G0330 [candidate division WS6 bacterium GW2011_GWF2_39_15]|uniref:Uncharacterized protein n=1 Tax=candidate division WS6 bacterium GW2011_GWF2_39_15 TaxID=1619100 RepID=A0A0G0Q784_9BACT|nr:MAG: hypothetical protein UT34_C0001G0330 [candidate division WS6 bacterium GW2011_GWF2_39_15]
MTNYPITPKRDQDGGEIVDGVATDLGPGSGSPTGGERAFYENIKEGMTFDEYVSFMQSLEQARRYFMEQSGEYTVSNVVKTDIVSASSYVHQRKTVPNEEARIHGRVLTSLQQLIAHVTTSVVLYPNEDAEVVFREVSAVQRYDVLSREHGIRESNGGLFYITLSDIRTVELVKGLAVCIRSIFPERMNRDLLLEMMNNVWRPLVEGYNRQSIDSVGYHFKWMRKSGVDKSVIENLLRLTGRFTEDEIRQKVDIYYNKI